MIAVRCNAKTHTSSKVVPSKVQAHPSANMHPLFLTIEFPSLAALENCITLTEWADGTGHGRFFVVVHPKALIHQLEVTWSQRRNIAQSIEA